MTTHPASVDVPGTGHLPTYPGRSVTALVDGTDALRRAMTTGYPDTMFSVPARASIGGRKVKGFIMTKTVGGYSTPTEDDPLIYVFVPMLSERDHVRANLS